MIKKKPHGTKTCIECRQDLPFTSYYVYYKQDGTVRTVMSRCKDCISKKKKEAYKIKGKEETLGQLYSRVPLVQQKWNAYRHGALSRDLPYEITVEEFKTFWQKPCHYCGTEIDTVGIDRVDSSVGYILDNCVSCCKLCNWMKRDFTDVEFIEHANRIASYQKEKN